MRTTRARCTFLVVMMILTACSSGNVEHHGRGLPPGPVVPGGGEDVVFRIDTRGGFTSLEYQLGIVPQLSIFGDGRVIVSGPVTEQYPPHALPNLLTGTLAHATVVALATRAIELNLLGPADFGSPGVSDMPTTTVTLNVDGHHELKAYAADFTAVQGDQGVSSAALDARRRLSRLTRALTDTATKVATEPYVASAVAVHARPIEPSAGDTSGITPNTIEWPLGDLATLGTRTDGTVELAYRCTVLTGSDSNRALAAARDATSITRWLSHAVEYSIVWRPLLPDEHRCP